MAITGHDNIEGALAISAVASFPVIAREEVKSSAGDIIGIFLREEVPGGLRPLETVERIIGPGGLVLIPQPFDRVRPSALKFEALMQITPFVDLMVGYNGHTFLAADNNKGVDFSLKCQTPTRRGHFD
ncbi:MAG: hypothetical protein BZY87_01640 [SAR202 cluster bacterium Io17-Chloro-G6]|nr:MAG: hypothetical protein BZY87_01640 [SAR202 cluster bacterium Io17-Chloro-G6]